METLSTAPTTKTDFLLQLNPFSPNLQPVQHLMETGGKSLFAGVPRQNIFSLELTATNRSQRKLQLVSNKEINFRSGLFARHLSQGGTTQPSLVTQIILFRHLDGAHHLVTCASARSLLSDGINTCCE